MPIFFLSAGPGATRHRGCRGAGAEDALAWLSARTCSSRGDGLGSASRRPNKRRPGCPEEPPRRCRGVDPLDLVVLLERASIAGEVDELAFPLCGNKSLTKRSSLGDKANGAAAVVVDMRLQVAVLLPVERHLRASFDPQLRVGRF